MPPNTLDASQVIATVLDRYEPYLPIGLAPKVRTLNPARIFQILPEAEYRPHFDRYFRSFFAAINTQAFGTKRMLGLAWAPDNVCGAFNCPAFCAPAVNVEDRHIYINRDIQGLNVATLYHEFIHYLSHPSFYPEYYALGGDNPKILEGVTEYLTRGVRADIGAARAADGKYQTWLDMVTDSIGAGANTERHLARLAFLGDLSVVDIVGGVRPQIQ